MGKNQIQVKDNHGHATKVHRKDIKKIPMTDKISQIFKEEQVNETRNGRKAVPAERVPNLAWDRAKRDTACEISNQTTIEEIQAPNKVVEMVMRLILFLTNITTYIKETITNSRLLTRGKISHMPNTVKYFGQKTKTQTL